MTCTNRVRMANGLGNIPMGNTVDSREACNLADYKSYNGTLNADLVLNIFGDLNRYGRGGYVYNADDTNNLYFKIKVDLLDDNNNRTISTKGTLGYGDTIMIPPGSNINLDFSLIFTDIKLIHTVGEDVKYSIFIY